MCVVYLSACLGAVYILCYAVYILYTVCSLYFSLSVCVVCGLLACVCVCVRI